MHHIQSGSHNRQPNVARRMCELGMYAALAAVVASSAAPVLAADSAPADRVYQLGAKSVMELKVKSVVGPSLQVDAQGRVGVAWMEDDKDVRTVFFARGAEPGVTIGTPTRINQPDEVPYWRQETPALAVDGDEIYVTWALTHPKLTPEQPLATQLRLSRSSNGGQSFGPSVLVNDDSGVIQHTFDALHRDTSGRVHVSWIDARDAQEGKKKESATYAARSMDRGTSVLKNVKVDGGTCVCCRTALASGPDGTLYVAWRKVYEGEIRETVVARSLDGGETFSPPVIVGNDKWVFPACPHRPASMGVDAQGRLYVVWYTEGVDETPAIFLATSDDRGETFSPKRQLNTAKNTFPDHPQLAVDAEGHVVVMWEEQAPVKRDVVISVSTDRGQTFTAPHKVNDKKSQTPAVATNARGQFALGWMEHGMPGHKMVLQTLRFPDVKSAAVHEGPRE
ncbi:MAG: exo-alpha-sialidase [Nitrospiraceae bacterium]